MARTDKKIALPDAIRTERLILRAPRLDDAPALQRLADNKAIHRFLARLPHPYTKEHAVDFITNLARTDDEHAYAITTHQNELIGVIGWHLAHQEGPELGYWLGQPHWGKGYATEAATALVRAARDTGHKKLLARTVADNKGSLRVLNKSGFREVSRGIDDCGQHRGVEVIRMVWEADE